MDDIFRRGSKIRFIWIFKIYNIINILIQIIQSFNKFVLAFPALTFFKEYSGVLYNDTIILNNFVVKALEEAAGDNYMLMPYFDMLQFY
jgi:hypothetical protein